VALNRLVFFDPASPAPYALRSLESTGLGGTEASVVRVAEALDAVVMQPNRETAEGRYRPAGALDQVDDLVVVRDPAVLQELATRWPRARLHLWLHDRMRPGSRRADRLRAALGRLGRRELSIVCVSDWQRRDVVRSLAPLPHRDRMAARTIYNPIDETLGPDGSPVDPNRLGFFSAPAKGLRFALDAFGWLRRELPDLELDVAHPAYQSPAVRPLPGVRWLGSLPHHEMVAHLRRALCVFTPNFVVPETFGLVFAEAQAVGTPVLTHAVGAAAEVIGDPTQTVPVAPGQRIYEQLSRVIPVRSRAAAARLAGRLGIFDPYRERIRTWQQGGRPDPVANPRFRIASVAAEWRKLFAG
jgi:glycosyltransferase involved in cell wall biosynthesis